LNFLGSGQEFEDFCLEFGQFVEYGVAVTFEHLQLAGCAGSL
jgi:hypothetical protein